MGNEVKGGQFILQQKTVKQDNKREFRSVSLKPEEIRQFGANTAESAEMAKARRIKEHGQAAIKQMEAKRKEEETEAAKKEAEEKIAKKSSVKEFDPNNLDFGALIGK